MTNKLKYFVGNWKMFGNFASLKIINQINSFSVKFGRSGRKNKIILCVPNTLVNYFSIKFKSKNVTIGAQNCHHNNDYGAFTGSVNAKMLKSSGAKYVILGHSENRLEGDTNYIIRKKIDSAIKQNLNIIFCIGESLSDKKKGKTLSVLKKQMNSSLNKNFNSKKILIAYEPVWSIGTGKIPKTTELVKIFKFIKNYFKKTLNKKTLPYVLYGGSVNDKNIGMFSPLRDIDGFLIGSASQSSKKFIDIIKNYYK